MTPHDRRIEAEYRTEERLGILLQGVAATLPQLYAAKQEALAQVAELAAAENDFGPLKAKLETIYGARRWSYAEECLMIDILRAADALAEAETILKHYNALPSHRRQYFPQSAYSLLMKWAEVLDQSRLSGKNGSGGVLSLTARKKAITEVLPNHPGNPESVSYSADVEDRKEFKALKAKLLAVNLEIAGVRKPGSGLL